MMFKYLTLFAFLCAGGAAFAQDSAAQLTFESCRACHGSGEGEGAIPSIQGQPYDELLATLESFAQAEEASTIMHRFVTGLTQSEIDNLARYVSSQEDETR